MDPSRPGATGPDPELLRLAAKGTARRAHAASTAPVTQDRDGDQHLRLAIGAYRGSALRRALLVLPITSALVGGVLVLQQQGPDRGAVGALVFGATMALFFLWLFVPPIASRGAMAREADWVDALPFELVGYFEMLSETPRLARHVTFEIQWEEGAQPPDRDLLFSALGAVDPEACVESSTDSGAFLISGSVSGQTAIRKNRVPVYRNHALPGRVHDIVDQLLVPLHRSHPMARVSIRGR